MLLAVNVIPHCSQSTRIPLHFRTNMSISFFLSADFSRNILRSDSNSSFDLKHISLRDCGRSSIISETLVWWPRPWSLKRSMFSEEKEQRMHLISRFSFLMFVLQFPNLWFLGTCTRNFIGQFLHWFGFSPVCCLVCNVRLNFLPKVFSHSSHLCFLIRLTAWRCFICSRRMWGPAALYGQILHGQTIPSCLFNL